ncbi:MAG: hypoxanthine phosphoribosyltransferase [Desulfobacteraceae bacterium]|nr:hypoxanthine phosphoribosyltransferase [Desulfobacteraceae bacterium]MCF8094489.1 hypoxanthine phosphoribosyltransferase [Desulfobacteraceae bacterium]
MSEFSPVLSEEEIRKRVVDLATQISLDYRDEPLVVIGVLKGAFIFMADLVRQMNIPVEIDFIRASSYGQSDTSSGEVLLADELHTEIAGKHVLIVEDILDTGRTIERLISCIEARGTKSVRVCACVDKKERRETNFNADYICFSVEKGFLVGYGLDYAEKYRYLPAIYALTNSTIEESK